MAALVMVLVIGLSVWLSIIEIPKMIKCKHYKELWVFIVLLFMGVLLTTLKVLDLYIPNPSEWVEFVYSPVTRLLKNVFE